MSQKKTKALKKEAIKQFGKDYYQKYWKQLKRNYNKLTKKQRS
jgi:hypothetical protein